MTTFSIILIICFAFASIGNLIAFADLGDIRNLTISLIFAALILASVDSYETIAGYELDKRANSVCIQKEKRVVEKVNDIKWDKATATFWCKGEGLLSSGPYRVEYVR